MPISPARIAAFDILLRVEREDAYASELLHSPNAAKLKTADHALTTEIVMGVLRWRSLLDEQIARRSTQGIKKLDLEVITALRLGAYQALFLDRVPARAAVNESVELVKRAHKRSATSFVNAILRKIERDNLDWEANIRNVSSPEVLAGNSAHPLWIVQRWATHYGLEIAKEICAYDQRVPETAIRIPDSSVATSLEKEGIELAPGKLLTSARRVKYGDITKTHAFREGRVFLQDEASQLVALLLGTGNRILDCCAAPGGKTRVLAERNPKAQILAAEVHPHRARILRKLVSAANVQVISADATQLPLSSKFDLVLADVPCSGTGTLARNPEIKWRLCSQDFSDLVPRQYTILKAAMQHVSPGGRLLYSTCSLEPEENEAIVQSALDGQHRFHILDCGIELRRLQGEGALVWGHLDNLCSGPFLRTTPGLHPCDGFFAALLEYRS
jgi:16S rRNA (cytosine967-C5)-methyltransferase